MKRSQAPQFVHVGFMAADLGLSKSDINLALVGPEPKPDLASIAKIKDLKAAQKLFKQAKSLELKTLILKRAVEISSSFDDLEFVHRLCTRIFENSVRLNSFLVSRYREIARAMIEKASTFDEVHKVWIKLEVDMFSAEDLMAFEKLWTLIPGTDLVEVLQTFECDGADSIYYEGCHHYDLVIHACSVATPEQALKALKYRQDREWDGEQDSYPIRLLLKKAASLYAFKG